MTRPAASNPSGPQPAAARIDDSRFRSAQRHSRRVRGLKFVLPALAALLAVGFFGYSYLAAPGSIAINVSSSALKDGKLVMANPKLDGFTKNDLPYTMTALRAIQDIGGGGPIELESIAARVPVSAENWAEIEAARGVYHNDANRLDITSELTVKTTDGMVARLKSASFDLETGSLTTADPVDIRSDGSTILAERLSVTEGGKVLVFEDRVRVDIDPDRLRTADATPGSANESQ